MGAAVEVKVLRVGEEADVGASAVVGPRRSHATSESVDALVPRVAEEAHLRTSTSASKYEVRTSTSAFGYASHVWQKKRT